VDYERDVQKTILQNERWLLDRRIAVADYELAQRKQGIADEADAAKRLQMTNAAITSVTGGGGGAGAQSVLAAANRNLGLFAGESERCADAMRVLFKEANIGIGVTKQAWDGLASGGRLASSFFGSDIGQKITNIRDLRPGDLVGFERTYGNWGKGVQTHVGVYAGGGMMYDHSSRGGLTKRPLSTFEGKFMYGVRPNAYGAGSPATTQMSPIFQRPGAAANNVVPTGGLARPDLSMPSFSAPGVKPIDVSGLLAQSDALKTQGAKLKLEAHEIGKQTAKALIDGAKQDLDQQLKTLQAQLTKPFDEMLLDQQQQADYQKQYSELLSKGILPDLAEQLVNIRQQVELKVQELNLAIAVQQAVVDALKTEYDKTKDLERKSEIMAQLIEQQEYLNKLKGIEPSIREGGRKAEGGATQAQSSGQRLQDAYTKVQGELNALLDPVNQVIAGANAIGAAFGDAFRGIISGSMSAREALSQMFQQIGAHFIDMATQMIAKYLEMKLIGLAQSFLGGAAGGAGPVAMPGAGVGGGSSMFMPGAPSFFATGGFVTGPTRAVIGEGGESEYVIPSSKMGAAMSNYRAGRRGAGVLEGGGEAGGGGGTFTLETVVINRQEYATIEQVREMGAAASRRGAEGGHAKSMGALRNSRSQRARLGIR
jgi:hypothetical protein